MKATKFEEMINRMLEVAEEYTPSNSFGAETLDRMYELLWDNFECLITEDDRNYN